MISDVEITVELTLVVVLYLPQNAAIFNIYIIDDYHNKSEMYKNLEEKNNSKDSINMGGF